MPPLGRPSSLALLGKTVVAVVLGLVVGVGCGAPMRGNTGAADLSLPGSAPDAGPRPAGCEGELQGCFTVYAHSDHLLYRVDLANKGLIEIGPFNAPMVPGTGGKMVEDVIQDLAVSRTGDLYVVSRNFLYTADANTGHVTKKGPSSSCGGDVVALTFVNDNTPTGSLYAADYMTGAFCRIDAFDTAAPRFTQLGMLGQGYAVAGDLVAIADGTLYATAYLLKDGSTGPTATNNVLVTLDPKSGAIVKIIGSTGYPKLYGIAFEKGQVFGFTHDGSGDVITIDPKSGRGTAYGSFTDMMTMKKISFAGAGVNADVPPPPVM